jgi:hypothetical protein
VNVVAFLAIASLALFNGGWLWRVFKAHKIKRSDALFSATMNLALVGLLGTSYHWFTLKVMIGNTILIAALSIVLILDLALQNRVKLPD